MKFIVGTILTFLVLSHKLKIENTKAQYIMLLNNIMFSNENIATYN